MNPSLDVSARRDLYALSARLLSEEIDAPMYRTLASEQMDALCEGLELQFVEEEVREMPEDAALEELAVEYCRLFVGPLPKCVPYGSAQMEDALLGGRARTRLEAFMQKHGLSYDAGGAVASVDHIAVHFAALAQLYAVAADESTEEPERSAALSAVHELLAEHLLPWAPRFFAGLQSSAERALYRTVGMLGARLLEDERVAHGI